jgi:alpha-tubulin suppressor-like RCC1 family protein
MWLFLLPLAHAAPFAPDGALTLTAGQSHTCALVEGSAWCWGGATRDEVKAGTWSSRRTPERVALPGPVVSLSAGGAGRTCAVTADERVHCWGLQESPSVVAGVRGTQVDVGLAHACAVGPAGVSCWGSNSHGQLGTGDTTPREGPYLVELPGAVQVAAGDTHSCARLASGQVQCWGSNAHGQLGSEPPGAKGVAPRPAMWVQDAVSVAAGSFHTCLVRAGGGVLCAGDNLDGQLGDGSRRPSAVPVVPQGVQDAVQVDAGFGHTCATRRDGAVYCWGASNAGQLGSADNNDQLLPGFVRGLLDARSVAVGQQHTCVVRPSGPECMGGNRASQLGDGTDQGRSTLGPVVASE